MAFEFSLERVLRYRAHMEKKAQFELAYELGQYRRKKEHLKNVIKEKEDVSYTQKKLIKKGTTSYIYSLYQDYIEVLREEILKVTDNIGQIEDRIIEKQHVLKDQSIRRQTIDKLREKMLKDYIYQYNKNEQMQMDELFIMRRR